jgi:hypothetical protein
MAKSGTVTGAGSNAALVEDVSGAEAPVMTLGAIAAAALAASSVERKLEVDLMARTVKVYAGAATVNHGPGGSVAVLTQDDASKRTSEWTAVKGTTADTITDPPVVNVLAVSNAQAKPTRSLASLINALDDSWTLYNGGGAGSKIIVDQDAAEVIVEDSAGGLGGTAEATFTQQVTDTAGNPGFAFE